MCGRYGCYYRKYGNHYPGSIEQLEKTNNIRFLRQKYVDPMTGKADWRIIHVGEAKTTVKGFFGAAAGGDCDAIAGERGGAGFAGDWDGGGGGDYCRRVSCGDWFGAGSWVRHFADWGCEFGVWGFIRWPGAGWFWSWWDWRWRDGSWGYNRCGGWVYGCGGWGGAVCRGWEFGYR